MFGISRSEIEEKIATKATQEVVQHGKVELKKFGTISYNKETGEWKFWPSTQLEQAVRRTGQ